MSTAAGSLKDLHQLHIQLSGLQERRDRGPKLIEARKRFAASKDQQLKTAQQRVQDLRKSADQKSLQLKTNEAKIADLRTKLNTASSNREYDIISGQIEADTVANSVLEDEILEMMEKIDAEIQRVKEAEAEALTAHAAVEAAIAEVSAEKPQIEREIEELTQSLKLAEGMLRGEIIAVYRRLVQAHGAGALAAVEHKACTACYTTLAPQETVQLNTGKVIFCRSCGRMLYLGAAD